MKQKDTSLPTQPLSLYKETRTLIFDYATHNSQYKKELIIHLSSPNACYVLHSLQEMLQDCLLPLAACLGKTNALTFTNLTQDDVGHDPIEIEVFLQFFARNEEYSLLISLAEGKIFLPQTKNIQDGIQEKTLKERDVRRLTTFPAGFVKHNALPLTLVLLIVTELFFGLLFLHDRSLARTVSTKMPVLSPIAGIESHPTDSGLPRRIRIPRIQLDAAIQHVGVTPEGTMDVPTNSVDTGWLKLGPRPGDQGSAVIAGHFDGENGATGVFDKLNTLIPGDRVEVIDDKGTSIMFLVRDSRIYDPQDDAISVFNQQDGSHLNLITCDGVWDNMQKSYTKRLVIFTDIIANYSKEDEVGG